MDSFIRSHNSFESFVKFKCMQIGPWRAFETHESRPEKEKNSPQVPVMCKWLCVERQVPYFGSCYGLPFQFDVELLLHLPLRRGIGLRFCVDTGIFGVRRRLKLSPDVGFVGILCLGGLRLRVFCFDPRRFGRLGMFFLFVEPIFQFWLRRRIRSEG